MVVQLDGCVVEAEAQPLEQVLVRRCDVVHAEPDDLWDPLIQHPFLFLFVGGSGYRWRLHRAQISRRLDLVYVLEVWVRRLVIVTE